MATVQLTKLVFSNIGDPKKARALMKETEDNVILGSIIGICTGRHEITRKSPDGLQVQNYLGLKGTFEGIPADPEKESVGSGICFMPEAFTNQLLSIVESEENGGKPVRFAAEVGIIRATNPQGYSWRLKPIGQMVAHDPLEDLREFATQALPARAAQMQLEHKTDAATAHAASAAKAKK